MSVPDSVQAMEWQLIAEIVRRSSVAGIARGWWVVVVWVGLC